MTEVCLSHEEAYEAMTLTQRLVENELEEMDRMLII